VERFILSARFFCLGKGNPAELEAVIVMQTGAFQFVRVALENQ
jgi:hypothetical protein